MIIGSYKRISNIKKIGTQCVHVASQKKYHDRMFISKTRQAVAFSLFIFLKMPTMQSLDVKSNG